MISSWIVAVMALAAVYSITVFIVQVVRYFRHKSPENELLDQKTDELSEE